MRNKIKFDIEMERNKMPTSSFDKEFIITDVGRFIEALEKSAEFNKKNKDSTKVKYVDVEKDKIKELFWNNLKGSYKLCYVREPFAFFTTKKDVIDQWGDDWDDAPYEHNAGDPYEPREDLGEDWKILKIAYESNVYIEPSYGHINSEFSVEDINKGMVPWLRGKDYLTKAGKAVPSICVGESLSSFIEKVEGSGGVIYLPRGLGW